MTFYDTTTGIRASFRTHSWTHEHTAEREKDVEVEITIPVPTAMLW